MVHHQGLDHSQTDSRFAEFRVLPGNVHFVEPFPDAGDILFLDADTCVLDADDLLLALPERRQGDGAVFRELDGVLVRFTMIWIKRS